MGEGTAQEVTGSAAYKPMTTDALQTYFERLVEWRRGLMNVFHDLAPTYPRDTPGIAYLAPEMVEALHNVTDLHRPLRGDWRNGYRNVCAECSDTRSEPYYNETRTWREGAEFPCRTLTQIAASVGYPEVEPWR